MCIQWLNRLRFSPKYSILQTLITKNCRILILTIGEQEFMKKSIKLGLAVCAISLNSMGVLAASDDKYPASDFQPKVTYIDESAVQAQSSASDDKYPASNFQPKVTYIDESAAGSTQVAAATVVDEKYPASNFQSKVIYSDESVTASPEPAQADQFDPKYPAAYFKPRVIYP
jgi:hypothetical protein